MAVHIHKQREDIFHHALVVGLVEIAASAASFGAVKGGLSALAAFALLLALLARTTSKVVRAAQVEAVPGALVFRGRGRELRLDVGAVDSFVREEPRLAVLRQGKWTVRLRIDEADPIATLDGLLAQIPVVSGERAPLFLVRQMGPGQISEALIATLLLMVMVAAANLFVQGAPAIFMLAQAVILLRLLALLVPIGWSSLTVGQDGLLVRDRWSRTFVPYSRIRSVNGGDCNQLGTVRLDLEGGKTLTVTSGPRVHIEPILVAIEAHRQRHAASELAHDDRLARAGRPLAAWRAELENPSAFRSFTPSPEELRAVLASPMAPLEERVGAALALRRVPGEGNARIRVAASVTAHPELRVALETLAEEELDEARLDSALAVAHRALR